MEDQSLFNKCQANHLCSIDLLSCSLKDFTLAIIPSLQDWIYSSPRVVNIDKYTGSRSDIWKTNKQRNKKPKKPSGPFISCQKISPFLTSLNSPNVSKFLCISTSLAPTLSSAHFNGVFTLYTSMIPMKQLVRILSVTSMLPNFIIPSLSPLDSLLSSTLKHSYLFKKKTFFLNSRTSYIISFSPVFIDSLNILYFFSSVANF